MTLHGSDSQQTYQKCILVTGSAGFVASHLVEALLNQDNSDTLIIGIDNFITGRQKNLDQIDKNSKAKAQFKFLQADVSSSAQSYLAPFFEQLIQSGELTPNFSITALYHLASPASPPRYQAHPVQTYRVNAFATHELLSYIKLNQPLARFVYASTSEVYGDPKVHPQKESYWGFVNPNGVRSCYDESKRMGESVCGVFERNFGLDVRIMRIFNTYGPRMDPQDGRVIPNFIKQAIQGDLMTIYGNGDQTRSYCYVSDLVAGIMKLGSQSGHNGRNLKGVTINLGNPDEYSIQETARIIYETVNKKQLTPEQVVFKTLPSDDPTRRCPDISMAQEILDWKPTVSLEEGLKQTINYFLENENITQNLASNNILGSNSPTDFNFSNTNHKNIN
jgi:nucleoside-diphosphate-sugar epimerase